MLNSPLLLLFSLLTLTHSIPDLSILNPPIVAYVDTLATWSGCSVANALGLPSGNTTASYNTISLCFWLSQTGPTDAALAWQLINQYIPKSCGFGSTNITIQQALIKQFHNSGINVVVSAFGSSDTPSSTDATQTCSSLAQFVLDNNFDGVDLSYEDGDSFTAGTGEQWLIDCTRVLRQTLPKGKYLLTHAPQAPYFTTANLYPNGAYVLVDQTVGNLIDWYNVQYYNQGPLNYVHYADLFQASLSFPGTAVLELTVNSIYGIVVLKPATENDASSGFVDPSTLAQWIEEAQSQAGWCGGVGWWQFKSDKNGTFGEIVANATVGMKEGCRSLGDKLLFYFPIPIPMPETEVDSE